MALTAVEGSATVEPGTLNTLAWSFLAGSQAKGAAQTRHRESGNMTLGGTHVDHAAIAMLTLTRIGQRWPSLTAPTHDMHRERGT